MLPGGQAWARVIPSAANSFPSFCFQIENEVVPPGCLPQRPVSSSGGSPGACLPPEEQHHPPEVLPF